MIKKSFLLEVTKGGLSLNILPFYFLITISLFLIGGGGKDLKKFFFQKKNLLEKKFNWDFHLVFIGCETGCSRVGVVRSE